jgi:putative Holliday junction resolvase
MAICNPADLPQILEKDQRLLGLDVGTKTIGLALSDTRRMVATPLQSVRQFARNLLEIRDLPVVFWDERLSTAAVERAMIEADLTRRRRSEIIDRTAAAYILQGLLDRLAHDAPPPVT